MLTDAKCRNARKAEKPQKLSDAHGLYLYITPTGFKSWRMKYRFANKEKRLTFGGYPEVSLADARELTLLFDPEHALDDRITMEQFAA